MADFKLLNQVLAADIKEVTTVADADIKQIGGASRAAAAGSTKSMHFVRETGATLVAYSDSPSDFSPVNVAIGGGGSGAYSFSIWMKPAEFGGSGEGFNRPNSIFHVGGGGSGATTSRRMSIYGIRGAGDIKGRNRLIFESGGRVYGGAGRYFLTNELPASFADFSTWSHVVGTYPGGSGATATGSIYIDGVYQLGTGSSGGGIGDPGVWPGVDRGASLGTGDTTSALSAFSGNLCDAAVWDKELSQAEVTTIYGGGSRVDLSTTGPTGNIIAWWKMGDGVEIGSNGVATATTDSTTRIYNQTSSLANWPAIVTANYSRQGFEMTGSSFAAGAIQEDSP